MMASFYILALVVCFNYATATFRTCGSTYYDLVGTIDSHPSYGVSNYKPSEECFWYIYARKGYDTKIQIVDLDMEPKKNNRCSDFLAISYYGKEGWSKEQLYCGNPILPDIVVKGNYVYVGMRADYNSVTGRGFRLKYSFVKSGSPVLTTTPTPTTSTRRTTVGPPVTSSCGVADVPFKEFNSRGFRIVGGTEANPGSWPWTAGLLINGFQGCGATLIHPQWAITAAHCFRSTNPSLYKVKLGMHSKDGYPASKQLIGVSKVFIHESYNRPKQYDNDITLLKLEKPATINSRVKPACLPTVDLQDGQQCFTIGWGRTHGTSSHGNLKQAMVPVVERNTCRRSDYYGSMITDNMICAGYEAGGHDSCQGDSGGPFVCRINGKFELSGVVSWGYGCAKPKKPGVYAKVKNYISWIKQKMDNE